MDSERLISILDQEIPLGELRVEEKRELRDYAKVVVALKEQCCYRPSCKSKEKTVVKLRRMKHRPYRMLAMVASCLILGVFSISFFTNNTILVKKKGELFQLTSVLGYPSTVNERLKVNLSTSLQEDGQRNAFMIMEREMEKSLGFLSDREEQGIFEVSGINTTY